MKRTRSVLVCLSAGVLIFVLYKGLVASQTQKPQREWTLVFQPYRGDEYEKMPIQVISVEGTMLDNRVIRLRDIRMENKSDKVVKAVQGILYLYNEQSPETLVSAMKMHIIRYPDYGIKPGGKAAYGVGTSGLGYAKALGLMDEQLKGDYRIVVGICRVEFEDGSVWETSEKLPEKVEPETDLQPRTMRLDPNRH